MIANFFDKSETPSLLARHNETIPSKINELPLLILAVEAPKTQSSGADKAGER